MHCAYCEQIARVDPAYAPAAAEFDLGSAAPRCARHWRYVCGNCCKPSHFMATAYCAAAAKFFCSACATQVEEVSEPFWAWSYYWRYRSPWSGRMEVGLDRLEFEGAHPLQRPSRAAAAGAAISREPHLVRHPVKPGQWRMDHVPDDAEIKASWDANADRWAATYDQDGDRNRRYQSDEPMLAMLGDLKGLKVLDAGCGQGYLCRKLAKLGALVTGVELTDRFFQMAGDRERRDPLGVRYIQGSLAAMPFLNDGEFDKAVSNYVLNDVRDYEQAVREVARVVKRGGVWVVVISHPCFSCGPEMWEAAGAIDSPRREDRLGWVVDDYFRPGPVKAQWGALDPVISFDRPLRDYWRTFVEAGWAIDGFDEPSVSERGRRELSGRQIAECLRRPYSCIFRLVKK